MTSERVHLSIVTPAYKCRACIGEMHARLTEVLTALTPSYEIIFVDDASPEKDWQVISEICAKDPRVKGLKLSRNFGQHYAITAGLDVADGDWVVVMDCDLQDPPEEIGRLYAKAQEGNEMVLALRTVRKDSWWKVTVSRCFYGMLEYLSESRIDSRVGSFRILSRRVVLSFRQMREQLRFVGVMIQWMGFKTAHVEVAHAARFAGRSSYNWKSMFRLATSGILSFSNKPLYLSIYGGVTISVGALGYGLVIIFKKLVWDIPIEGWTTLIVSLYFLAGLILFNIGVMGMYVAHIFTETKRRPLYIVEDAVGL